MNVDIVRDPIFLNGFLLVDHYRFDMVDDEEECSNDVYSYGLNRRYNRYDAKLPFQNKEPEWILEEPFSKHRLALNRTIKIHGNRYSIFNPAKSLERGQGGILTLEIVGSKEYKKPRHENEPWPRFRICQKYTGQYLKKMKSLSMHLDMSFLTFENKMGDDYDPSLHTLQVVWYLLVGNLNPKSKGYGDFFYFGLPLIDAPRYTEIPDYCSPNVGWDGANHKIMFQIASKSFLEKPLEKGTSVDFTHPVLSEIKGSFEYAKEHWFMKDSKFEDLEIVSMTLGFEAPGAFDSKIRINSLSIDKEE